MRTLPLFTAIVAYSGTISASPTRFEKQSFSINLWSRRSLNQGDDGPSALRKAMIKYGMPMPDALQKRQMPNGTAPAAQGDVTATDVAVTEMNDLEYLSPVQVGDTMMRLDFDTGSSDLWVFSNQLPSSQLAGHAVYNTGNNGTGKEMEGSTWQISYGDGSGAQGLVYADKVVVGGATATMQAIEAATSISTEFMTENSDGLMGLGFGTFNTIRPQRQQTFFENIKSSLQQPVFTVSLKKNASGTYDFGFVDPNKYAGDIQYIPVNSSRGYWEYTMTGFAVGNETSPTPAQFQSIADTGTTLMLLPSTVVDAYYAQVSAAQSLASEGGFVFPCDSQLPDLTVLMSTQNGDGGATATIPGEFVNRSVSATGSGLCYGGIQQGSDDLSIWGDVFLKSQFVVFDGSEPPRIGFAPQANGVSNGTVTGGSEPTPPSTSSTALVSAPTDTAAAGSVPCSQDDCGSDQGFTYAHSNPLKER